MHTTPPMDNKQEPVEEPPTTTWLDKATEQSPAAKLLRKLAREKNKAGDVVRVYGSEDWIRENIKLLCPTTTYCMTNEETRKAIQSLLSKAKKGKFDKPSYVTEDEVWCRFRELQEALIAAEARERVSDNLKSINSNP